MTLYLRTSPDNPVREKTVVPVKREFVYDENGNTAYAQEGDQELWVQVVEKAYAQALGSFDFIARGGSPQETFEVLTGKKAEKGKIKDKSVEELQAVFEQALQENRVITASSMVLKNRKKTITIEKEQSLTGNHTYYLKSSSSKLVSLRNPQGKEHLQISWSTLIEYFENYTIL